MSATESAIITKVLTAAIERQVSDVHLSAGSQAVIRRDGKLEVVADSPVMNPDFLAELISFFLPEDKRAILEQQKAVTVGFSLGNRARFRVHVTYQKGYPEFDLRYIPMQVPSVTTLGLPRRLVELTASRQGIIILTGPLGSGRTTTLASLVDAINHREARHIVTLEDPVEYLLVNDKSLIEQRDIGDDVPTLPEALQALRSEDVDVVALGATLPPSAWPEVVNFANSGSLVLAIVDADSTVRALEYLTAAWPGVESEALRQGLSETFLGACAQRLVPRLGGGRVLVTELLLGTQPVLSLVRDGKVAQLQSVLETSREEGMVSLERALANVVKTGEVMREEALVSAANRDALESLLRIK